MKNNVAVKGIFHWKQCVGTANASQGRWKKSAPLLLVAGMFMVGSVLALTFGVPVKMVMKNYSYDVLVIMIVMELFTNLIAETGAMEYVAILIAQVSQGKKRWCLLLFGGGLCIVSSMLNNITAVLMILPVVFTLLKAIEADRQYICVFFAVLLALSNTGGAASPVGDFPALVILSSGITTFVGYLIRAFPLFLLTSAALIGVWVFYVKPEKGDGAVRSLAVSILKSQYANIEIRFDVLKCLGVVFSCMLCAWCTVPQELLPPEVIAVLGYCAAMVISSAKGMKVRQFMNLGSVLTIASFLFLAQVIAQIGVLEVFVAYLQQHVTNPKVLMLVIMVITSLIAGLVGAGPAAAAIMPVVVEICSGPLAVQSDWIAVAYAAAICSGSSLFMWSATAGFILSAKVNAAGLEEENGSKIAWGVGQYLKYGMVNYAIQLGIALTVAAMVL